MIFVLALIACAFLLAAIFTSDPRHRHDRPLVIAFMALCIVAAAVVLVVVRLWPPHVR